MSVSLLFAEGDQFAIDIPCYLKGNDGLSAVLRNMHRASQYERKYNIYMYKVDLSVAALRVISLDFSDDDFQYGAVEAILFLEPFAHDLRPSLNDAHKSYINQQCESEQREHVQCERQREYLKCESEHHVQCESNAPHCKCESEQRELKCETTIASVIYKLAKRVLEKVDDVLTFIHLMQLDSTVFSQMWTLIMELEHESTLTPELVDLAWRNPIEYIRRTMPDMWAAIGPNGIKLADLLGYHEQGPSAVAAYKNATPDYLQANVKANWNLHFSQDELQRRTDNDVRIEDFTDFNRNDALYGAIVSKNLSLVDFITTNMTPTDIRLFVYCIHQLVHIGDVSIGQLLIEMGRQELGQQVIRMEQNYSI